MEDVIKKKVVMIGDESVGKTSLLRMYSHNDLPVQPTISGDPINVKVDLKGNTVNLTVWDTAGQETYKCLVPMYIRGSSLVALVFDLSRRESFHNLPKWMEFINEYIKNPLVILIGNKYDLDPEVSEDEVNKWANEQGIVFIATSAVTEHNVETAFATMAQKILEAERASKELYANPTAESVSLRNEERKRCC